MKTEFRRYGVKESSAVLYMRGIRRFCVYVIKRTRKLFKPEDFTEIGLERIEDLMTDFIADHRDMLAPKYLNVIFNAVKRWCYIQRMIKTTKMFKEIKFDKSSRKTSGLMESMLETKHVKTGFKIADLDDQVDLGLYSLIGLRPQLIPQLKVKDVYPKNYEIDNGTFRFTVKQPIMIIPREYKGNKGNITFMVFIPTKLAELIEIRLNAANGEVTPHAKISEADNAREIYYKMKKILTHEAIGFNGRPYLLRSFADNILERITRQFNDNDFKEFLMGHKGAISAIYQMRGLTTETEAKYREMYTEACDKWISEQIFEMWSKTGIDKASVLVKMAEKFGASKEDLEKLLETYTSGKLDFEQLDAKVTELVNETLNNRMEQQFEKMYLRMQTKYNGAIQSA